MLSHSKVPKEQTVDILGMIPGKSIGLTQLVLRMCHVQ